MFFSPLHAVLITFYCFISNNFILLTLIKYFFNNNELQETIKKIEINIKFF